jgi:hypothetical protein
MSDDLIDVRAPGCAGDLFANPSRLAKLTVELIELSQDPTIRTMFTSGKSGRKIDSYVSMHHLRLSKLRKASGDYEGIELVGKLADLQGFIQMYLSEDSEGGVYNLVVLETT